MVGDKVIILWDVEELVERLGFDFDIVFCNISIFYDLDELGWVSGKMGVDVEWIFVFYEIGCKDLILYVDLWEVVFCGVLEIVCNVIEKWVFVLINDWKIVGWNG